MEQNCATVDLAMQEAVKPVLSIIIPSYNTSKELISPLLNSLSVQIGIDSRLIETIVVDDASTNFQLDSDFIERYNLINLRVIHCKTNGGPGVARQVGIDSCQGDYMLFCDADDVIYSVGILNCCLDYIKKADQNPFDMIRFTWAEEFVVPNTGEKTYKQHQRDQTWMHGKVYRKAFVKEHNVFFHPSLRVQEDSFFNGIFFQSRPRVIECVDIIAYIWRYIDNSITRANGQEYSVNSIVTFIDAVDLMLTELLDRKVDVTTNLAQVLFYLYFTLQFDYWWASESNLQWKQKTEHRFIDFYLKFFNIYERQDERSKMAIYSNERCRIGTTTGIFVEKELFPAFVERLYADKEAELRAQVEASKQKTELDKNL